MPVALATNALTLLATVKDDLGITGTASDDKLTRLINAASDFAERFCQRIFWRDTAVVEKVAGHGTVDMLVDRTPINSIASILFQGSTVNADDYESVGDDADAGIIKIVGGWDWTAHFRDDTSQGILPNTERKLFTVTYDGGWYTPAQSQSHGTLTLTGQPANDETMVINDTTITAKTSGASTDEFNIGASARATADNLAAAINAGGESANVRAWRDGLTVIVAWLDPGTDGNTVVFTTALANTTADDSGTLGGTQAGVARTLPFDLEEAIIDLTRKAFKFKTKDPNVKSEKLLSWSATYVAQWAGEQVLQVLGQFRRIL